MFLGASPLVSREVPAWVEKCRVVHVIKSSRCALSIMLVCSLS